MKSQRQKLILEIISTQQVETQEELLARLQARGCKTTQATISRDIKELRLVKELSPAGTYHYVESVRKERVDLDQRLHKILREGVTSVDLAQNLIVLKTMPGLASGACAALDQMKIPDMVGSLAGDDTALLIMRSNGAAEEFYIEIKQMFN
jgi:transcriptional regulator of arginine metabolism